MGTELLWILLLLIANGLFAMAEFAIVSSRKARLQQRADDGSRSAQKALEMANDPSRFLSTIQIGITLVGIFAGALGGATVAEHVEAWLRTVPWLAPYSSGVSITLVVLGITFVALVGELVPKRIALHNPEKTAMLVAGPLKIMMAAAAPVVKVLSAITEFTVGLFRRGAVSEPVVTEDEIRVMIAQGTQAGVFAKSEQAIVESVFRFGDLNVSAVMTPRPMIVWLDTADSEEEIRKKIAEHGFSVFPVCQGAVENIVGVVQSKDLLGRFLARKPINLPELARKPLYVPENTPATKVLDLFRKAQPHVAIVVDEYGSIQGLITLTNILEALVGDLPVVGEEFDPRAVRREDGSWLISGMMPVPEFKEKFDVPSLPGDEEGHYQTLGGFIVTHLGRIPKPADHFELGNLRYEVVDMDGLRVDKVLINRTKEENAGLEHGERPSR